LSLAPDLLSFCAVCSLDTVNNNEAWREAVLNHFVEVDTDAKRTLGFKLNVGGIIIVLVPLLIIGFFQS